MEEKIVILGRKQIVITGATKVLASTASQAVVETEDCNLIISGKDLQVLKLNLDNKEVEFSGSILALKYTNKQEKVSLLKRIFR